MNNSRNTAAMNVSVLVAVVSVLAYDFLGAYQFVALGIASCAAVAGSVLYFRRIWDESSANDTLSSVGETPVVVSAPQLSQLSGEMPLIEIAAIPESACFASQCVASESLEDLMLRSQQLHQDVISSLLVQLEKSSWDTETAKRLWMNIDYSLTQVPQSASGVHGVKVVLSLDGRLSARKMGKTGRSKWPSSQWHCPTPGVC